MPEERAFYQQFMDNKNRFNLYNGMPASNYGVHGQHGPD